MPSLRLDTPPRLQDSLPDPFFPRPLPTFAFQNLFDPIHTPSIFNVCGNDFRLITAIHYDKQRLYTLRFLTHAEYDKNKWKKDL